MRLVLALAALALAVPVTAQAQYYFNGYFGQNKVQYSKFDFQIIQTDHFDIYSIRRSARRRSKWRAWRSGRMPGSPAS